MTTAVITQPTYLPWLGAFQAMEQADVYVVLDTVQFQRRSWHSRNRLRDPDGQPFWVTVPVSAAPQQTPLLEIQVGQPSAEWSRRHLTAIELSLGAAPHGATALDLVRPILSDPPALLVDLNAALIAATAELLGLRPTIVRASALDVDSSRSELLVEICRAVGADRYHSAAGSREYMEEDASIWAASGLTVTFQEWEHPIYPQRGRGDFTSHLAAIDAIANVGAAGARALLGGAPS